MPAAQTFHVFKTVALKIGGRVHAARALMIVNTTKIFARPVAQNFLHQFLREQMRVVDLDRVEFFARAHIDKLQSSRRSSTAPDNARGSICIARSAASLATMCSITSSTSRFSFRAQTCASVSSGLNPQLLQPPM